MRLCLAKHGKGIEQHREVRQRHRAARQGKGTDPEWCKTKTSNLAISQIGKTELEKNMDLMNLKEPLKSGRLISRSEKAVEILFPLGRFSFPKVVKPRAMQEGQAERFGIGMIWNVKDPSQPAFVNFNKPVAGFDNSGVPTSMWAELQKFAQANKLQLNMPNINPFGFGVKMNQKGELIGGYEAYCAYANFAKYPKTSQSVVACYGPDNKPINPEIVEENAGWYGRVRGQMYINKPRPGVIRKVCLGLVSVQLIAEGERFGGEPTDTTFEAVDGATIGPKADPATGFDDEFGEFSAGAPPADDIAF